MLKIACKDTNGKEKTITKVTTGLKDMKRTLMYSKKMQELYEDKKLSVEVTKDHFIKTPNFILAELDAANEYLLQIFGEDGLTQEILDDEINMTHREFFEMVNDVQVQIMGGITEDDDEKKSMKTTP